MYAPGGVVNDVYGFKPHAPRTYFFAFASVLLFSFSLLFLSIAQNLHPIGAFFDSIKYVELASTLLMAAVAALPTFFPNINPANIFSILGGGRFVSVTTLCVLSPVLTMVGAAVLLGGAVLAYGVRVGFNKKQKKK